MKRILALLLTAVLVAAGIPITAGAATDGLYTYEIADGKATITDVDTSISGDVIIPDTLGGCPVTSIGYGAFWNCDSITNVTIPDSVTSIGEWAFRKCSSLTSVVIPDSVTSIGNSAFYWCSGLASVTIGNGVTSIGEYAFDSCDSLTSVAIGNGVTSIGEYAFGSCDSLASIDVDENNTAYKSIDGVLFSKDGSLLIQYPCGKTDTSYTTPDGVTSIGYFAFSSCKDLVSVIIGNGVTSIDEGAFTKCENLVSVTISPSVAEIGLYAFDHCYGLDALYIEDIEAWCRISFKSDSANPLYLARNLYLGDELVTKLTIPDSVTEIGAYAFTYCESLDSVVIPDSVTAIGDHAFSRCYHLKEVTIGNGVTTIGENAFWACDELVSVAMGNGVTTIGMSAFYGCSALTSVTIPASVTFIGDYAFRDCDSLTIYCYDGSYAKEYAIGHDIPYELLDCEHPSTELRDPIPATCTADGSTGDIVCAVCGEIITAGEVIPATGHTTGEWEIAVEATEDSEGLRIKYCTVCGEEAEHEVIPMIGASTPGDASGDGKVNIADASLILKKIAGWDSTLDDVAADVTGDDKVNLADVSLILKYIAGWDVTFK